MNYLAFLRNRRKHYPSDNDLPSLAHNKPVENETAIPGNVDLDNIINDKGYIKMYSAVVREIIYLAKDEKTVKVLEQKMKTEKRPEANVIYTLEEVGELIKEQKISPEGLKRLHNAKIIFGSSGGKIIHAESNLSLGRLDYCHN